MLHRDFESKSLRLVSLSSSRGVTLLVGTPRNDVVAFTRPVPRFQSDPNAISNLHAPYLDSLFTQPPSQHIKKRDDPQFQSPESAVLNDISVPCLDHERVVTILFDRSIFSERDAEQWWQANKRFPWFAVV